MALERHDNYSYMRVIDVFLLCMLFAKKEGIQNIEHYAIGFLFHDIGKLNMPIDILKIKGLFQTKGIYPFLLDVGTNEHELLKIANYCEASAICVISKEYEPIQCQNQKLNLYYIGEHQLENFTFSFAGEDYSEVDMKVKIKDYKAVRKL